MEKIILSIGMIVKNEIRCIERCLKALQPLRDAIPCEVVIADTGSTDGTRQIIEKYADHVFDFEWIDDFSAARNAVIDRCSGQWYLSIDADEYFESGLKQLVEFLSTSHPYDIAAVVIKNFFDTAMEGNHHDFHGTRLFRLGVGIRFYTPIHEYIETSGYEMTLLDQVSFLHDGYAFASTEDAIRKEERNLKLLDIELEKDPTSLRRINQCIESSNHIRWKQCQYIFSAMDLVMSDAGHGYDEFRQAICRSSIQAACELQLPTIEKWCDWIGKNISDNLYYKVDITYCLCTYNMLIKKYDKALYWSKQYKKGIALLKKKDTTSILSETFVSPLRFTSKEQQMLIRILEAECLANLGNNDDAVKKFIDIDVKDIIHIRLKDYLRAASLLYENKKVQKLISDLVSHILSCDDKKSDDVRERLCWYSNTLFADKEKPSWQIFLLCEGTLGLSAKIMQSQENACRCQKFVEKISDWKYVPAIVYRVILQLGLGFTESCFHQPCNKLHSVVVELFKEDKEKFIPVAIQWIRNLGEDVSLYQAQFVYYLTAVASGHCKWESDDDIELAKLFIEIGDAYIPELYHPAILEDHEFWSCIPALHQFSLHLSKGLCALNQNNELEWVKELRRALKAMPSFKAMIQYLQKHPPVVTINQELRELAEKVQTILSQYDPNDPAVLAIKASPVYQKVAHLLIQ